MIADTPADSAGPGMPYRVQRRQAGGHLGGVAAVDATTDVALPNRRCRHRRCCCRRRVVAAAVAVAAVAAGAALILRCQ
jgi:hypothetical protein